jgi:hypothetical protein
MRRDDDIARFQEWRQSAGDAEADDAFGTSANGFLEAAGEQLRVATADHGRNFGTARNARLARKSGYGNDGHFPLAAL